MQAYPGEVVGLGFNTINLTSNKDFLYIYDASNVSINTITHVDTETQSFDKIMTGQDLSKFPFNANFARQTRV